MRSCCVKKEETRFANFMVQSRWHQWQLCFRQWEHEEVMRLRQSYKRWTSMASKWQTGSHFQPGIGVAISTKFLGKAAQIHDDAHLGL